MKIIIGLGNPGIRYRFTRHNLGFWLLDSFGEHKRIVLALKEAGSLIGKLSVWGQEVVLAKPQTYMNLSGRAVAALVSRYRVSPKELVVCCDDVALPLGRMRIREKGGSGGHKGLKSIIEALGTEDFPRLRMGVARSQRNGDLTDYVLAAFRGGEKTLIRQMLSRAVEALEVIIREGIAQAMNRYNPE